MSIRVATTAVRLPPMAGRFCCGKRCVLLGSHRRSRRRCISSGGLVVCPRPSSSPRRPRRSRLAQAASMIWWWRAPMARRRQLRGFAVPAPQTAGTWLRRFSLGHIRQLDRALAGVHRRAFGAAGVAEVTLDFDSTYVFSRSTRRQGVDRTYKKGYALHPLLCFDAVSGAAVHARLRRGKTGPSTGMKTFLTETLRRVPAV